MPDLVKLTIDGNHVEVTRGTLLIEAARQAGIEIPAFCYYPGLSLQAACRMCLVEVEKAPKLMASCTLPVAEGMVVRTQTPAVAAARRSTLEFLLTNHPLDCPVCDKGGECELQDMVFRYGAGESRFAENKIHVQEKQWSPVVFYDAPRCILCFRCVRVCGEGMGVGALGIVNRGAQSEIAPNGGDHLDCDQCGACIDICPVGALTSGAYRYKTRPWEMTHSPTICAHCSNGCTTTLGVRNNRIIRANNRDRSGINGEFLCVKGRYAFDFHDHPERLKTPLVRAGGNLAPASWPEAIHAVAAQFEAAKTFGVIGGSHTTNEENRYLARFAREVLGTGNIDHHRTGDVATLLASGAPLATTADLYTAGAVLILGADLAQQQPFLSWQVRANHRHHGARVYVVTPGPVREDQYAEAAVRGGAEEYGALRDRLAAEPDLVIVYGDAIKGDAVRRLVAFGCSLGIPVKYVALVDYANSRGAVENGLTPDAGALTLPEMLATNLDVLYVVGANPLKHGPGIGGQGPGFLVVQDLFLTETAAAADVVLPAASAYEKDGTITNVCGEVLRLKKAVETMGPKSDLEIMQRIAGEMGAALSAEPRAWTPATDARPDLVWSSRDSLFTSGTLGRYSKLLAAVRA
ncbi:MAG TPA: NADH-quinone oxidoreductase subunit NuoG [Bryobacteraceae bacterium]|nr:NADH-quinone oxidoreductase subunit NuoG [Bryobacteraceae bacterium]